MQSYFSVIIVEAESLSSLEDAAVAIVIAAIISVV
jgi:hypothetical protein